MPDFNSLDEAKAAIEAAETAYGNQRDGNYPVLINGLPVNVICERHGQSFDCGLPAIYKFTGSQDDLKNWWLERHADGAFLERKEKKHLGFQVNLQFPGWVSFNYHLAVS